ncbi:MAG: TonB-dependent receptor [Halioglobus sp.]
MFRVPTVKRSALAVITASLASPAIVPMASAQNFALEEVIVTARRRAESLQETPVAVTALNAEALREAGINNLSDLNQIVPNIEVSSANGNAPLANIYIRGVGQRNSGANIDSGVGIYIDEIYVGRPDGGLLDLNDVQSVQVLRGPQGTLFGKNTTGGALVFTTNKPVDEFEGSVGVRVGNYDRLDGDFVLNVPITDSLWTRLSGVAITRDGYIENRYDGEMYMDEDRQSLIWQTRWVPSDNLVFDLNANWAETEQKARPQKCVPVPDYQGWQAALFNQLGIVPSTGKTLDDFCEEAAEDGDTETVISDLGGDYHAENMGVSFIAEWDISDDIAFKSISGWRSTEAAQDDELDNTGTPFLHRTNLVHPTYASPSETDQYSQEFQLNGSAFDDRMQFVTGLYWYQEQTGGRVNINYLGPWQPALLGPNSLFLNTTGSEYGADNESISAFAQVEWEFNDNWRTTVGLRYTDETREFDRVRTAVIPDTLDANGGPVGSFGPGLWSVSPDFVYNPDFRFETVDYTKDEISNSDVTPMASVQYLFSENDYVDNGSVYLTYTAGFLSGGLSEGPTDEFEEFLPEEVENLELGVKLDLMDRRLRINGALYYSDYTNRQLTALAINPATSSPANKTINAAKSSIKGLELETTWLATENLTLTFNLTLNDGDIEEFDDNQITLADTSAPPAAGCQRYDLTLIQLDDCPNDRSDENLPRLPEQTYLLAAQYTWDTSVGTVLPRLQAAWKYDIDYCFDAASCNTGLWLEDEQFDLNARVTWISRDEKWVGAIYGTNLTEEDYVVGGTALVESAGVGGQAFATPRMYGAELQYNF